MSKDQKVSALGLKSKEDKDNSYLASCIWCDKNGNEIKTLRYNTKEIYIKLTFKNVINRNYCKFMIRRAYEVIGEIYREEISKEVILKKVDLKNILDYSNLEITSFNIKVIYNNVITVSNPLFVHFVIFIPEIMDKLKWINGARLQREWFTNEENDYPWQANPRLNFYSFEWALSFSRFKKNFDNNEHLYKSEKGINLLKTRINQMITDKLVKKPNSSNKETTFGVFENDNQLKIKIINPEELNKKDTPCNVPLFDLYHYNEFVYDEVEKKLDDFTGSVANTTIRIIASGVLKFENNKVIVYVQKVGYYIKDGFDYVGYQFFGLGNWHKNKITTDIFSGVKINNSSFREYRKDTNMGQDFYVYSTVMYYNKNFNFEL